VNADVHASSLPTRFAGPGPARNYLKEALVVLVMGAAIVREGRVLAARRTSPEALQGGWELPGGKVEPGEQPEDAVVREVAEELGCRVEVHGHLSGEVTIRDGYTLRVALAGLLEGEPMPREDEHDAVRWLGPEELDAVPWLEPDVPFLAELRDLLLDGLPLHGGNVGGAVRIGHTVRREVGPWTSAVHALLDHLRDRQLPHVPRVLGTDVRGREILTYLPGTVVDVDADLWTVAQLESVVGWAKALHGAAGNFRHPGPWRLPAPARADVVGHNDLAPYNVCFAGDRLVGVIDWDVAGPTTALLELAFIAWNGVPLYRDVGTAASAERLEVISRTYGGFSPEQVLHAVPERVRMMLDAIPEAAAAGDEGMRGLMARGEPQRSARALAQLEARIPDLEKELCRRR
jgi:mutator protein MutT